MKQKLDEIRTLAIQLFEAANKDKRRYPPEIWGNLSEWRDLASESVSMWDAVAIEAYRRLKK